MGESPAMMTVNKSAKTAAAGVVEFVNVAAPEAREENKIVSTEVRVESPADEARAEPEAADEAAAAPPKK